MPRLAASAPSREIANGLKQFRAFLDKLIETAGEGAPGTIVSQISREVLQQTRAVLDPLFSLRTTMSDPDQV